MEFIGMEEQILIDLANMQMPFGKYSGRRLIDLPEAYVLWFKEKGYPNLVFTFCERFLT